MGDENLLDVVQTIFGLPPETAGTNIDAEAADISQLMPIVHLQDPTKLQQLTERFTAMYDLDLRNGGADASTPLTVVVGRRLVDDHVSAASTILGGVISANSSCSGISTAVGVQQRDDGEHARSHSGRLARPSDRDAIRRWARKAASLGQASRALLSAGARRNWPPRPDASP